MPPTYTPKNITKLLGIPPSTLRRYAVLFGDYISPQRPNTRRRSYTPGDLAIFAKIKDLSDAGIGIDDIREQLGPPGNIIDIEQPPEEITEDDVKALALPGILKQIETFRDRFEQQQEQIAALMARDENHQTEMKRLQDQVDQLAGQLEEAKRPWYKRIFRR